MSPQRDPETGKFVSSTEKTHLNGLDVINSSMGMSVPAADLSGGNMFEYIEGDDAELVDFSEVMDPHHQYEVLAFEVYATLSAPTTATAEGSLIAEFAISRDGETPNGVVSATAPHWGGTVDRESGIADVSHATSEEPTLFAAQMVATNSSTDSVNGTGAGSDWDRLRKRHDYDGRIAGPVMDSDDELYAPTGLHSENVSDYGVVFHVGTRLVGKQHHVDEF